MYKVGQKVKVIKTGYNVVVNQTGKVTEVLEDGYKIESNGMSDFLKSNAVISVGRVIGSKNKKKAKSIPKEERQQYLVVFNDGDSTRVSHTLFGDNLLQKALMEYSAEALRDNVSVYKAKLAKVELVTNLVIK